MSQQNPSPIALRVAVVGGGCSGFSYHMAFENQENPTDNIYEFDGLKVLVDQMSEMYLEGGQIDYIETLEGAGFKFNNPNAKSTCGCGSSFRGQSSAARAPGHGWREFCYKRSCDGLLGATLGPICILGRRHAVDEVSFLCQTARPSDRTLHFS